MKRVGPDEQTAGEVINQRGVRGSKDGFIAQNCKSQRHFVLFDDTEKKKPEILTLSALLRFENR